MNELPPDDQALDAWAQRILHTLPERTAPPGLELRVLAEIARRDALPWWRRSFAHWPAAARIAFVAGCTALVAPLIVGGNWLGAALRGAGGTGSLPATAAHHANALITAATQPAILLTHAIPPGWLSTAVALLATLYAALFALGAAAYRTLYLKPSGQVTST